MNDVQAFIDRQLGFCTRPCYDSVLKRLEVSPEDSFYGLQNSGAETTPELESPIFACRFAEAAGYEHILALANEDGRVAIQDTSKVRVNTILESFQCHNNAVFDLTWRPGHMNFVTVSGDHTASLWQLTPAGAVRTGVCSAHSRSVKCAAHRRGQAPLLATGARDGHVLVWDLRASQQPQQQMLWCKPDHFLWRCHAARSAAPRTPGSAARRRQPGSDRPTSITGLVFQDDNTLISCGECDGSIKVWDLRKSYSVLGRAPLPLHTLPYCGMSARCGYTNLLVDSLGVRLYASCMDGVIYCFNISTYPHAPVQRYAGHESGSFYIKAALSDDDRYLVSGSSDKHAYLWSVSRARPLLRLAGHAAEVTCAAWRGARAGGGDLALVTCSDDARHNIWRVGDTDPESSHHSERGHMRAGWTEPPPQTDLLALLNTPVSAKRRKPDTPSSAIKRARVGAAPKSKRCLADMMNAAGRRGSVDEGVPPKRGRTDAGADGEKENQLTRGRTDTGPDGEKENELKRGRTDPGADSEKENQLSGVKRRRDSEVSVKVEAGPSDTDRQFSGSKRRRDSEMSANIDVTPPKRSPNRSFSITSPTKALPDYVASGEAPHLRLMSPAKRRETRPDWLTLMARDRRVKETGDAPASARARETGDAPAPDATSAAVSPATRARPPAAPRRTLLSYFNPAGRDDKK